MPLWLVLEDAVAGVEPDQVVVRRAPVPEPRPPLEGWVAPVGRGDRLGDLVLIVVTVVVLLVAAAAVLLLPAVR